MNPVAHVLTSSQQAHFWARVDTRGPCWLWTGAYGPHGYGNFKAGRRWWRPHRVAYELTCGPIPAGFFVCHRCDTKLCCRPEHLFAGTARDNALDMKDKGRARGGVSGERNGRTRLTNAQVCEVRLRFQAGEPIVALAPAYGVSYWVIWNIVRERYWRHLIVEVGS